jgi:hypothetical protein
VAQGLRWGSDIEFTYGPLGFLSIPTPYLGFTSSLALAFSAAVYVAGAATVLFYATRSMPGWAAILATIGIVRLFSDLAPFEMVQVLAFIWFITLCSRPGARSWTLVAIVLGVLVGFLVLAKLNAALVVGAMAFVVAARVTTPWWRGILVYVVTAPVTIVALWLVSGQRLGELPQFASASVDILRGYSESMGIELFPQPVLLYGLLIVSAGMLAVGAFLSWYPLPRTERLALAVLAILFVFGTWKGSFVRSDGHVAAAFVVAAVVALPLTATDRLTRLRLPIVGAALLSAILITGIRPASYLDIGGSAALIGEGLADSFVPGRQVAAVDAERGELRYQYGLEPGILASVSNQTTHIDPQEAGIAFAYPEIRWSPLPTIQSYVAYTPSLDEANAERLRGPNAPTRILRERYFAEDGELASIDHRNPWFESPAAALEMLCRYDEVASSNRWQVLARSPRTCGTPELMGSTVVRGGETVAVPVESRRDRFVTVKIGGVFPGVADQLLSALWRGREWYIALDGARYRLVAPVAGDGLIMAVPASIKTGPAFAFGEPVRSLSVESGPSPFGPAATITYDFYSIPWNDAP